MTCGDTRNSSSAAAGRSRRLPMSAAGRLLMVRCTQHRPSLFAWIGSTKTIRYWRYRARRLQTLVTVPYQRSIPSADSTESHVRLCYTWTYRRSGYQSN
jgi:hypothetical protein